MPNAYLQGIQTAFQDQAQVRNDISVVAINWYVNRCPLVTRVPRVHSASTTFSMVSRTFRNRVAVLASAALATDTTLTLVDASAFMNGDVIQLASGERVEVLADPNIVANTISVRRGSEGTTPAAGASGDVIRLIANSRTGAEINQNGVAFQPVGVTQYCQTWQHPVQVGGSLQASYGYQTQPGIQTPFDQNKMDALQNLMDDMESSAYYGRGEDPSVSGRPKQKGLRTLLTSNFTSAPTNAAAYKPTDLIRDTMQACRTGGGDPDVLIVSTNFMTGLATWGQAVQRINAGVNVFGNPIDRSYTKHHNVLAVHIHCFFFSLLSWLVFTTLNRSLKITKGEILYVVATANRGVPELPRLSVVSTLGGGERKSKHSRYRVVPSRVFLCHVSSPQKEKPSAPL